MVRSAAWLLLVLTTTEACFSLGGCGFGGCLPLPTLSFGCGRFCRRAKGAKTLEAHALQDDGPIEVSRPASDPCQDPDSMFQQCCAEARLPDACMAKCTFRAYTKEALTSMFFKSDACPVEAAVDIHRCAAQLNDHRSCCAAQGVGTTLAADKCLLFCDQAPSSNVTQLDLSFLPCLERFDNMKTCFWHDASKRHAEFMQTHGADTNSIDGMEEFIADPPSQTQTRNTVASLELEDDDRDNDSSHEEDDIEAQLHHLNSRADDSIEKQISEFRPIENNDGRPWYSFEDKK